MPIFCCGCHSTLSCQLTLLCPLSSVLGVSLFLKGILEVVEEDGRKVPCQEVRLSHVGFKWLDICRTLSVSVCVSVCLCICMYVHVCVCACVVCMFWMQPVAISLHLLLHYIYVCIIMFVTISLSLSTTPSSAPSPNHHTWQSLPTTMPWSCMGWSSSTACHWKSIRWAQENVVQQEGFSFSTRQPIPVSSPHRGAPIPPHDISQSPSSWPMSLA